MLMPNRKIRPTLEIKIKGVIIQVWLPLEMERRTTHTTTHTHHHTPPHTTHTPHTHTHAHPHTHTHTHTHTKPCLLMTSECLSNALCILCTSQDISCPCMQNNNSQCLLIARHDRMEGVTVKGSYVTASQQCAVPGECHTQ